MAAKASAHITLTSVVDIKATYRYYLLQSSTLAKPAKPTTNPPPSTWGDAEPTYTSGSTNSLYYVDLTVFSNNSFAYSEVSLSTAYEAAKVAYNKAQAAQNGVDNMEIGGRNMLLNSSFSANFDKWGNSGGTIIEEADGPCCHMVGELAKTKQVSQNIFNLIKDDDISQTYVYTADVKLDNYVAGTTNPYVQLYFSGQYSNNGSSTWLGATTVSGVSQIANYNNQGWVRITWIVRFAKKPISMSCYIYARDFTGDLYFKNLKLEKGNKPTDWSPAPEDVDGKIDAAQESASNAQTTANNNVTRLNDVFMNIDRINAMMSTLVTGQNGETLMTQTDNGWTFNMAAIQNNLSQLTANYNSLNNDVNAAENMIARLNQSVTDLGEYTDYITFGVDNGKPCIILGETDSSFKVLITNTDIRFMDGSIAPATISNKALNITDAVINGSLQQGGFVWESRSNGNYGLIWKG